MFQPQDYHTFLPQRVASFPHSAFAPIDAIAKTLEPFSIAVVVPAFNVEREIADVLRSVPSFVRHIVVVNDASRDRTAEIVQQLAGTDPRIVLVSHERNQGVGGAVITGFQTALSRGAQLLVKIDGDGQMSPADIPALVAPLVTGEADYAKGNRFGEFQALRQMPLLRRTGNLMLSFFAKAATGYWDVFDPTNGFVAIRTEALAQLRLDRVDRGYFFEQSMLGELYLLRAVVKDVYLPARYGTETSHLVVSSVLRQFPPRVFRSLIRRILLKNFIFDFTMESMYLLVGVPMLLGGVVFGGYHWLLSIHTGVPAHTGTVVIPAMLIILGVEFCLSAIGLDLAAVPRVPISGGPLRADKD